MLDGGDDRISLWNFRQLAAFIEDYAGIRLPPAKKTMVEGRLRRRLRVLGLSSFDDYCGRLFSGGLDDEVVHLVDAITTNKTEFFREPEHFHQLVGHVLPDLLGRADRPGIDRPLRAWSAACSIGAEPYTLAMVLDNFGRRLRGFRFDVLATDICTQVLDTARMGVYPAEMADPVPADWRRHYLLRACDPANGTVRIAPAIRRAVRFGQLNLMDEDYGVDPVDVIFVRNVLIYFDRPTQSGVMQRVCRCLRPGGYLFLGHSETLTDASLPLHQVAPTIFRRT